MPPYQSCRHVDLLKTEDNEYTSLWRIATKMWRIATEEVLYSSFCCSRSLISVDHTFNEQQLCSVGNAFHKHDNAFPGEFVPLMFFLLSRTGK